MIETIAATLRAEIWAHDFDAPIRERLSACLPCSMKRSPTGAPTIPSARPA